MTDKQFDDEIRFYQAGYKQVVREMSETQFVDKCLALIPEDDEEARLAIRRARLAGYGKSRIFDFEPLRENKPELYEKIMNEYGLLNYLKEKSDL